MKKLFLSFLIFTTISAYCQHKSFKVEIYGNGQPVILIPGYACSGDVWKATVDNLKTKYQLHVLTLAGFAGVAAIDTPILKTVKNDLIQYVKDNHLNKPLLIGHSLGAFMSLWAASEEPSLFSKIICVDGVPFISAISNPSITSEGIKKNPVYNAEGAANNFKNMSAKQFEDNQYKAMLSMVSDTAHARLIAQWAVASDRKTLGYTFVEMSTTDLRKEIAKINIPVLVLGSTYGTKEMSQKILSEQYKLLSNKKILIASTKHFIMYDDPLWFREQVKNFLINGLAD
ncbi:MAG: alpha/beta hydrolase [Ginsengibacter sp.]